MIPPSPSFLIGKGLRMQKLTDIFVNAFVLVEKTILYISYALLSFMTLLAFTQVILRYIFNSGIRWVEEVCCLCIVWYGFISIAFGVINKEHFSITLATHWFPKKVKRYWARIVYLLVGLYGLFMTVFGKRIIALVARQTLPATKFSYSIVYASIPFAGVLLMLFSLMVATGFVIKHPVVTCLEEINWEDD